jgi:mannose/fructose/N-acetylgalactosamine-specific phosphotransferase system component IIC
MALATYASSVTVLGAAFVVLAPQPWLSPEHVAAGLLAVAVAWLAGQLRAFLRLRVPVFDVPLPPTVREDDGPGQGSSPASSPPKAR